MTRHARSVRTELRRAIALRDVIVLCGVIVLCAMVLLFTQLRHRELMRQAVCKQNLYAICTAGLTYAGQNRDYWPAATHAEATEDLVGKVEYVRAIGSYRGGSGDPRAGDTGRMGERPTRLSTTRNLWTLFRLNLIERDKFICPSTKDVANQEANAKDYWDFGEGDIVGPATPEQSRKGYSQVSYGYQVPYCKHARPSQDLWFCWLVADKGPYGAHLETGATTSPPAFPTSGAPGSWRPWNSPNHGREGQNALDVQTMVDFGETPSVAGWDNIYTQNQLATVAPATAAQKPQHGVPPAYAAKVVPAPLGRHNDTLIYP